MWPRRDVDRPPSARVEDKNEWSYAFTPHIGLCFHDVDKDLSCFSFKYKDGNSKHADHWGDPNADGRIILIWIFRKWEGVVGTGWSWLRIGTGGGHF